MAEDKKKNPESEEVSEEELIAAGEALELLEAGTFYDIQDAAMLALFGHRPKYIN